MLSSFRSRLVLSNLIITLIGLLIVGVIFTGVLTQRNENIKRTDLAAEARMVASQIEVLYGSHASPRELSAVVANASRILGVKVVLLRPSGLPIYPARYSTGTSFQPDQQALKNAESARRDLSNGRVLFQSPIRGTVTKNGGAVLLAANVSSVRPSLLSLSGVILIVLGTLFVVWLALGLYFTVSISQPLLRVIGATQRMARGDYSARVPARGDGEIAHLATSFNTMAQQVEQGDQVLKDFVANVSHDLRTPLTMIAGFSQALLDGTAQETDVPMSAQIIHDEADKMQRMVEDLLQLTRLESGLQKFTREPVDVGIFVGSIVERTRQTHSGEDVAAIAVEVPARLPKIEVDGSYLERALRNLLENALQYTPPAGRVTVGATAVGKGWVEISVADTGAGIPSQDIPRVFERFYRTSRSREREGGHSGLGLAIVQEIVEAHGGRITVESVEGAGTTFRFTVPQVRPAELTKGAAPAREPLRQPATR